MVVAHRLSSTLGIKDSSSILRMLIAGAAAGKQLITYDNYVQH